LLESNTSVTNLMVTSVFKEDNKILVYILNKNNEPTPLGFDLKVLSIVSVPQARCFQDTGVVEDIAVQAEEANYKVVLPEYSLTMIEFLLE